MCLKYVSLKLIRKFQLHSLSRFMIVEEKHEGGRKGKIGLNWHLYRKGPIKMKSFCLSNICRLKSVRLVFFQSTSHKKRETASRLHTQLRPTDLIAYLKFQKDLCFISRAKHDEC